ERPLRRAGRGVDHQLLEFPWRQTPYALADPEVAQRAVPVDHHGDLPTRRTLLRLHGRHPIAEVPNPVQLPADPVLQLVHRRTHPSTRLTPTAASSAAPARTPAPRRARARRP